MQDAFTLKIVTLCGSLREGSLNAALIRLLPRLAPGDWSFEAAPPISDIPHYDGDLERETGMPGAVAQMAAVIRDAAGVIIVSPEYNYSVPGPLKNALDWLSRAPAPPFAQKPVLIQSVSMGPLGGARMQYHLRQVLVSLNAQVFARPEIMVGGAGSKFDAEGDLADPPTREAIRAQLASFSTFCRRAASREPSA